MAHMEGDKHERRKRAEQQRRMAKKYPSAAALVGVRRLQPEDLRLSLTFHRWLVSQRTLAQMMTLFYQARPQLGARVEMSGTEPRLLLSADEPPAPPLLPPSALLALLCLPGTGDQVCLLSCLAWPAEEKWTQAYGQTYSMK